MSESHPLRPFLPPSAKVLLLGSFPPPVKRWKMPFYYPNFQNDMWRIMGIVFFNDLNHFINVENKTFKQPEIVDFLTTNGVAIYDTATKIERGNNDASDVNLIILETINLPEILLQIPECKAIVSTGGKSADVIADILSVETPQIGNYSETNFIGRTIKFYRMPSTSRAYPMKIDKKAEYYNVLKEILSQ